LTSTEKLDVIDLIIGVLRDHEEKLSQLSDKLERQITKLSVIATRFEESDKTGGR